MALEFDYRDDELRQRKRAQRVEQLRLEREKQMARRRMIKKYMPLIIAGVAILILLIVLIVLLSGKSSDGDSQVPQNGVIQEGAEQGTLQTTPDPGIVTEAAPVTTEVPTTTVTSTSTENPPQTYSFSMAEDAVTIYSEEVISTHALLVDTSKNEIVAAKGAFDRISPASMTKVLTVLVAAEHLTPEQLDDTFTMTLEITDYAYVNDCSSVGFLNEEVVTVRDLLYGTILPSGGDAAVGLAVYIAGSHEAFVELMNEKLEELGLSETAHFTNCVGLYDEQHYCTLYDMAIIMRAAIDNELCKEILSAHTYTTTPTTQHPEGIIISNWFLRRIEDKETGGEVLCAKTGYVAQSQNCAVSYGTYGDGTPFICVTAGSTSSWRCIYDQVEIFNTYVR